MASRIDAYVDTSALIAFLDRSDTHNALFRRLLSDPPVLATSALVVAEGHGWFLRRYDQRRAIQFLNFVKEFAQLPVEPFDDLQLAQCERIIKKYEDQKLTLADAHGLVLMQHLRAKQCWSTDRHLGLTRVPLVI